MILPTIHLNGSSPEALLDQNMAAGRAIQAALTALQAAAPNARDYYPQGGDAYATELREHTDRVAALHRINEDLLTLCDHLANEIDARATRRKER